MSRLGCFAVVLAAVACGAEPPIGETRPLRIALYDGVGAEGFAEAVAKALADGSEWIVERVTADDIRAGRLDRFDVLIQPGGSGGGQGRALGEDGREQVRRFVKAGGGYVGFCAGAYLATPQYKWSLGLLDAKVVDDEHWARGVGRVDLAVTGHGRMILGLDGERVPIHYENGPLLAPAGDPDLPDYESLANFAGEIAENDTPKGVMPGTTAIAAGRFGKGRVLCFSPHPEKTKGLRQVVVQGVTWAAGRPEDAGSPGKGMRASAYDAGATTVLIAVVEYRGWGGSKWGYSVPRVTVYQDGTIIFGIEDENGVQPLRIGKLNPKVLRRLKETLGPVESFRDLRDSYNLAPNGHDLPSVEFIRSDGSTLKTVRVYGFIFEGGTNGPFVINEPEVAPDVLPPALETIHKAVVALRPETSHEWVPEYIEVRFGGPIKNKNAYASETVAWPENWPTFDHPLSFEPLNRFSAGCDRSIIFDGRQRSELHAFLDVKTLRADMLIGNERWYCIGPRPVIPGMEVWTRIQHVRATRVPVEAPRS